LYFFIVVYNKLVQLYKSVALNKSVKN